MKTMVRIGGVVLVVIAIAILVKMYFHDGKETTDDAQIEQYISPINVKVAGYVKEIRFTEHQKIKKGDTLLIIDDREYVIAMKQAVALLCEAQNAAKVITRTIDTSSNSASVYDASIDEARLKMEKLQRDYYRYSALLAKNATTQVIVDQYKTEYDMAKSRLEALQRQRKTAMAAVSEVSQRQGSADAQVMRAESAVEMAKLNVSYTVVVAPCDGYLGRRAIEEGQLVSPGQTVTTIMPDTPHWVIANFKETQVTDMCIGQKVEIKVDAFPGEVFQGHITAISSATGSKYSKLPTDNSAGNFVKIRQRIPVRIDFDDDCRSRDFKLAVGMMCVVTVDISGK